MALVAAIASAATPHGPVSTLHAMPSVHPACVDGTGPNMYWQDTLLAVARCHLCRLLGALETAWTCVQEAWHGILLRLHHHGCHLQTTMPDTSPGPAGAQAVGGSPVLLAVVLVVAAC